MPLLKRSQRDAKNCGDDERADARNRQQQDGGDGDDAAGEEGDANASAKSGRKRRGSKRELFHGLISRSRLIGKPPAAPSPSTPQRGRRDSHTATTAQKNANATATSPIAGSSSDGTLRSPRSPPLNPNKPLPSPPPPGNEQAKSPPARPVLKLDRIMASLTDSEIEKLFSGAPQYFARSEGHHTGAPHPSVAFPWDDELEIRDLTDHGQIEVRAWGCATAWPHITRDIRPDPPAARPAAEKHRAHFYPRCRERPNMLSMTGLEKGSVGYEAALELGVADSLQDAQQGFESLLSRPPAVHEQRRKMLASRDGLRVLDEAAILEQLIKNGQRYSEPRPRERRVAGDLYHELFLQVLHPPTKVIDHSDPYSLSVQIQALVKVLAAPNMWIDFSRAEWRVRLGLLLWAADGERGKDGPSFAREVEGGSAMEAEILRDERYWLLLQILLACELLIRLDAITEGDETGTERIKPSEAYRFQRDAIPSVKWSMHLARAWLENIEVVKTEQEEQHHEKQNREREERPSSGWLATLTKRMSLSHEHSDHHQQQHTRHVIPVYAIKGKHFQRQVDGLVHFARRLNWPDAESNALRISENCRAVTEGTPLNTPLATPTARDSQRSSYFGGGDNKAPNIDKTSSRRLKISTSLQPSGWLSKSYVSGLMLPGETICHFLMSTLLENDPAAMSRLGSVANLCGGFVYGGMSFWSTACIVGRVLAAGKGSAECMAWVSSDITPQGFDDGWVDVEAEDPPDARLVGKRARLWAKTTIEKESNVLGDVDPSSVLPADFIIPFETIYKDKAPPSLKIAVTTLRLRSPADASGVTPSSVTSHLPEAHTYPASISFAVSEAGVEGGEKEYTFSLSNDVYFVTAHPCAPSQYVKILKSPSSPTIQHVDLSGSGQAGKTASIVGHPLHKYYTYTAIHLSELLAQQYLALEDWLLGYPSSAHCPSLAQTPGIAAKVLVVDCITGFKPLPQEHQIPQSPVGTRSRARLPSVDEACGVGSGSSSGPGPVPVPVSGSGSGSVLTDSGIRRASTGSGAAASPVAPGMLRVETAAKKMHQETRRRQFGSDMEILVRALCAQKGWNALISRRRRGCLACAIREAGALGWKVIVRVD